MSLCQFVWVHVFLPYDIHLCCSCEELCDQAIPCLCMFPFFLHKNITVNSKSYVAVCHSVLEWSNLTEVSPFGLAVVLCHDDSSSYHHNKNRYHQPKVLVFCSKNPLQVWAASSHAWVPFVQDASKTTLDLSGSPPLNGHLQAASKCEHFSVSRSKHGKIASCFFCLENEC